MLSWRAYPPRADPINLIEFHLWAPTRFGTTPADYQQGRQYFAEALLYAQKEASPLFIFITILAMESIGDTERGFIDGAASAAIVGVRAPPTPDEWASIAGKFDTSQVMRCRQMECAMLSAIELSKKELRSLASVVLIELLTGDYGPTDLAVWQFAAAALNGSKS